MAIYVQGLSALAYYRNGGSATDVERVSARIRSLKNATSSRTEIVDSGIWRLGIGEPTEERPFEVLLRDAGQRTRSRAVRAKIWPSPLAPPSFRKAYKNIYISSPEFAFLQMATRLELPELIALGMEFCGTYRRNVELPRIDGSGITLTTAYQQPPLSNLRRLHGYIGSMKSAPGQQKALKALEYVLPDSASPMETALYLLLCLPRRLGGYALPKPVLNPAIFFSESGRKFTLNNSAKPDLYWSDARLDLEYNSDEFHGEDRRAISSMRRKALERMRVEVIGLTPDELFSVELFHATAVRIAHQLGRRIRSEREGTFIKMRVALRQMLLFDDSTAPPHSEEDAPDGQEERTSVYQNRHDAAELQEESIWLDGAPDSELWSEEAWDASGTWEIDSIEHDDEDINT